LVLVLAASAFVGSDRFAAAKAPASQMFDANGVKLHYLSDRDPVQRLYVGPLRRARPDWPLVEIEGAGHFNCIVMPQFRSAITGWINEHKALARAPEGQVTQDRAAGPGALDQPARSRVKSLEITILSTMLADRAGIGEWGFSALVVADQHRLLFDTGARPETVLLNARELKVELSSVTDVILSHHHGDHTGGLIALRRELGQQNSKAMTRAYVGAGIFLSRPGADGRETNETLAVRRDYEATGGSITTVEHPIPLFPGAWLTGPVPRTHPERNWSLKRTIQQADGRLVEDNVPEDMSLVLDTDKGLVVVAGCGHAGIINTLEYARQQIRQAPIHAALGGFHLFEADAATLDWTAAKLRSCTIENLLGAHCTGIEAVFGLRQRLGLTRTQCAVGAVGARFSLDAGIDPGAIAR
jgi:7,8-dihydropterin-6-yl-methyl-4-(beta-D-ribofuranosyl)aminobenzene 5'-phosphate synthase